MLISFESEDEYKDEYEGESITLHNTPEDEDGRYIMTEDEWAEMLYYEGLEG